MEAWPDLYRIFQAQTRVGTGQTYCLRKLDLTSLKFRNLTRWGRVTWNLFPNLTWSWVMFSNLRFKIRFKIFMSGSESHWSVSGHWPDKLSRAVHTLHYITPPVEVAWLTEYTKICRSSPCGSSCYAHQWLLCYCHDKFKRTSHSH